ncbi:uncharacterized protein ALTATR162_LOCUS6378 [Alternaria atra]|uniref:SET domain-containing protein n=1 Tax=Alternaria atra TaxID=119953 RepID=A0A8J2I1Q7_9PLEO|nr:uncharacterized protein ALTATR162_LOCUS6378 [Alternaria atra]CAG5163174.1 unnamed protein product [Alternaria atra]
MSCIQAFVISFAVCAFVSRVRASPQCANVPQHFKAQVQLPLQLQLCLNTKGDPRLLQDVQSLQHPLWSHKPPCARGKDKEYCTYTTFESRGGHALSIIATSVAADAISAAFLALGSEDESGNSSLEVRSFPGKGKGLVTTKAVKKGERLLLDSAHIIASSHFPTQVTRSQGKALFSAAIDQLPRVDRDLVLTLDQSLGGSRVEDIMKTNAFACQLADGDVDDAYMCLFPSVARINHACQPNAHARFVPKTMSMEIKAQRDIAAGEEIGISYGRVDLKHADRQALYQEGWNFGCTCPLCTASQYEIIGSDQRRARFAQLRKMLENLTAETYDAQQIVAWEKEVMEIGQREGLETLLAQDYERLAYVYAGHGMVKDARRWAKMAKESLLEWVIVDGGPDNQVRRIEELLRELDG